MNLANEDLAHDILYNPPKAGSLCLVFEQVPLGSVGRSAGVVDRPPPGGEGKVKDKAKLPMSQRGRAV